VQEDLGLHSTFPVFFISSSLLHLLRSFVVLTMFYDSSSLLLFSDVQVYAEASMNLPFQRKTIAILILEFFFVL